MNKDDYRIKFEKKKKKERELKRKEDIRERQHNKKYKGKFDV